MEIPFEEKILRLAKICKKPLYAVGGCVRNALIGGEFDDVDLASPMTAEETAAAATQAGLYIIAEYKRTGTLLLGADGKRYEFTSFRTDSYTGGAHKPREVRHTEDIFKDALRRDFKCNAVYYDIKRAKTVDPLDGTEDIKNRRLSAVKSAREVFSHDGLRLMRLARFAGELGFSPDEDSLLGARENSANIREIAPERIYAELKKILSADKKYAFSDKRGHYNGLKILDNTRVLDFILPELTLGRGMEQRRDYHSYDVLEHSLRCVLYAPEEIRFYALLHDVGKPRCKLGYGTFYGHAEEGKEIAAEICDRLKTERTVKNKAKFLTGAHMVDLNGDMKESKVRRYIVENSNEIPDLLKLKQADYSAGKDDSGVAPSVKKWRDILADMKDKKIPFKEKELNICAEEILNVGFKREEVGKELKRLLMLVVEGALKNDAKALLHAAETRFKKENS